jgi:catechol 2,3-dioxygenase-like lactoylglutathione lyase family enzyme
MNSKIPGLHHVTAIASDPQRNLDFYVGLLVLRFVKRMVNFDDPGTYHFLFRRSARHARNNSDIFSVARSATRNSRDRPGRSDSVRDSTGLNWVLAGAFKTTARDGREHRRGSAKK